MTHECMNEIAAVIKPIYMETLKRLGLQPMAVRWETLDSLIRLSVDCIDNSVEKVYYITPLSALKLFIKDQEALVLEVKKLHALFAGLPRS